MPGGFGFFHPGKGNLGVRWYTCRVGTGGSASLGDQGESAVTDAYKLCRILRSIMTVFVFSRLRFPTASTFIAMALSAGLAGRASAQSEAGRICEVKPEMRCLDKSK